VFFNNLLVYMTTDNTVIPAIASLLEIAGDNKIPVEACTQEDVKKGALCALGAFVGVKAGDPDASQKRMVPGFD